MDWNKLQHTLFALDPTDPAEDLRKLAESAGSLPQENAAITESSMQESVQVQEGTMPVEGDYSLSDFAALAGVTLNESQKTGSAGQLKSKDAIKKNPAGTTKNPTRDKLVGEDDKPMSAWDAVDRGRANSNNLGAIGLGAGDIMKKIRSDNKNKPSSNSEKTTTKSPNARVGDWKGFLKQHTAQLQKISADPKKKKEFDNFMIKIGEGVEEGDGRKKGIHSKGHPMRKKQQAAIHASESVESIKEMLYRKLNSKK